MFLRRIIHWHVSNLFPLPTPSTASAPEPLPLPTCPFASATSKMQFCRPPDRPLRPPRLRLDIVIRCPDQARTIHLDLDPENTTIATVQALVADEIKAEWRALEIRVLRDSLPAARVVLRFSDRELGMEDSLTECGIRDRSELEATVIRTDEEARLMRARTRKGEEMERRRKQRKIVGKQTARMKAAGVANVPRQENETEMEEEIAREAEERFTEEMRMLDAEFAVMEDLRIEELDEQDLDEARQAGRFQIRVEIPHEVVVQAAEEDAFEEEDADKENWNPQILRSVGGERGAR